MPDQFELGGKIWLPKTKIGPSEVAQWVKAPAVRLDILA